MKKYFAIILVLLVGCASAPMPRDVRFAADIFATVCQPFKATALPIDDGVAWAPAKGVAKQHTVCWETVAKPATQEGQRMLESRCGIAGWSGSACVMARLSSGTCWILSIYTREQAALVGVVTPRSLASGKSHVTVEDHEGWHCGADSPAGKNVPMDHDESNVVRSLTQRY